MIVYLLLIITLILAIWSLIALWRSTRKRLRDTWSQLLAAGSLAFFIYLYGTWVYCSIYARYAFGIIFLTVLFAGFFKPETSTGRLSPAATLFNIFFLIITGSLSMLYFTGTTGTPDTVALRFPLKAGKYFVLQGGKGLPTNLFHYELRGAIYAMDLVKLNKYGGRARKIFSENLGDYEVFNDTVYSPCDGRILRAEDEDKDNIPPDMERGPHNTNQVLIRTDSFYVFMGHLHQGSLLVHEGDEIKAGQPLARVGNSGFSLEPHLHIQVHARRGDDEPWYKGKPLYIEFDGKTYLLNEVISQRTGS